MSRRFFAATAMERKLIVVELRQFAIASRSLHIIPLICAGILAVSLEFPPPPLLAAVVIGLAGLEPQFSNLLFRNSREFQAMSLLPAEQQRIVRAKNIATILLASISVPACATVLLFFSRAPVRAGDAGDAVLFLLSLIFALLHAGNSRSLQYPRPLTGWQTDDLIEGLGFLITMAVFSLPYLLFVAGMGERYLCFLYAGATAVYWWKRSIPSTASRIEKDRITLCSSR